MKILTFILAIFTISVLSCTSMPEDESSLIIGEWRAHYMRHYDTFNFYPQFCGYDLTVKFNTNGTVQFFKDGVYQPQNPDHSWRIKDTTIGSFPKSKFIILERNMTTSIDRYIWMIDTLTPNRFSYVEEYNKYNGVNVISRAHGFDKIN
jgi:hypothetical protein